MLDFREKEPSIPFLFSFLYISICNHKSEQNKLISLGLKVSSGIYAGSISLKPFYAGGTPLRQHITVPRHDGNILKLVPHSWTLNLDGAQGTASVFAKGLPKCIRVELWFYTNSTEEWGFKAIQKS